MLTAIKRTLERLLVKIHLPGFDNERLLLEGLAIEFNRVVTLKDRVLASVIPNENMDADSITDYNEKYGIPQSLTGTNAQKIARIIERARLMGNGGAEFLEEQIQQAGYNLYVVENYKTTQTEVQFGNGQQAAYFLRFSLTTKYIAPQTIVGELIVGTSPGPDTTATPSSGHTYPVPKSFVITNDANLWGFFAVLSPTDGAIDDGTGLLSMSQAEFDYLEKIVISLKHQRNWIIAQVSIT